MLKSAPCWDVLSNIEGLKTGDERWWDPKRMRMRETGREIVVQQERKTQREWDNRETETHREKET